MLKKALFLSILILPLLLFGQKNPMKFGKPTDEDLAMTSYDKDPDAGGVVLCNFGNLEFEYLPSGFRYRQEHQKRVKIFKRSAFDEADIAIYYHKDFQKLSGLKAIVHSPDGTKTEVSKKDFFEEKIEDGWTAKKMALPNIAEGSIIEYKYNLISSSVTYIRPWYFNGQLPVIWSEFRISVPEFFKFHKHTHGWGAFNTSDCEEISSNYGGDYYKDEYCRFVVKDLPGYRREPFITTLDDYYFKMRFQLRAVQFPNSPEKSYTSTWEEVAKLLRERESSGKQYLKKRNHNDLIEAAAPLFAESDEETLSNISSFLVKNIKLKSYTTTYFSDKSLDDAFEKRIASRAERNLMLLALLRAKGIEADPVFISTRNNGRPVTIQPNINQFDHLLVRAKIGEDYRILDLSNEYRTPELLAPNCLNGSGFLVKDAAEDWIKIIPKKSKTVFLANLKAADNGTFSGTVSSSETGYDAAGSRKKLNNEDSKNVLWKKRLEDKFPTTEVSNFKVTNTDDISAALKTEFEVMVPEAGQTADDIIYLSPILYSGFSENPFKLEKRNFPVDLPYPLHEQLVMNIDFPEGWQIEELPESVSLVLPENHAKFKFRVSPKGTTGVRIISTVEISNLLFLPENYTAIKNFWDLIAEKMGEQIVLKKA